MKEALKGLGMADTLAVLAVVCGVRAQQLALAIWEQNGCKSEGISPWSWDGYHEKQVTAELAGASAIGGAVFAITHGFQVINATPGPETFEVNMFGLQFAAGVLAECARQRREAERLDAEEAGAAGDEGPAA